RPAVRATGAAARRERGGRALAGAGARAGVPGRVRLADRLQRLRLPAAPAGAAGAADLVRLREPGGGGAAGGGVRGGAHRAAGARRHGRRGAERAAGAAAGRAALSLPGEARGAARPGGCGRSRLSLRYSLKATALAFNEYPKGFRSCSGPARARRTPLGSTSASWRSARPPAASAR